MDTELFSNPTIAEVCLNDLHSALVKLSEQPEVGDWIVAEPETLVSALATPSLTTLQLQRLYAKICMLKRAFSTELVRTGETPLHELTEDPIALPYLVELVNNEDGIFADPEFLPHVSTMEIAWFVYELTYLLGLTDADWMSCPPEFRHFCGYYLSQEGLTAPVSPFTFIRKEDLLRSKYEGTAGQHDEELHANRQKAVDVYIKLMRKALCNVHN